MLEYASGYSVYAFYEEIRQGFFTIVGGHRIGVAGKVVMDASGVQEVRHISFLNVRVSHQIIGCAEPVLPYLLQDGLCHTLIISPPGCGKTTLLRDLIRIISNGSRQLPGKTVGVVDERSELAGCCRGVPQNDIGMRTDVLDGCRKAEGMQMLLRAMAPEVIAVDEIGNERDRDALEAAFHCGCKLLATAHGRSLSDIRHRPLIGYMAERGMFSGLSYWEKKPVSVQYGRSWTVPGAGCCMVHASTARHRDDLHFQCGHPDRKGTGAAFETALARAFRDCRRA